jgi:hypothetical protein
VIDNIQFSKFFESIPALKTKSREVKHSKIWFVLRKKDLSQRLDVRHIDRDVRLTATSARVVSPAFVATAGLV